MEGDRKPVFTVKHAKESPVYFLDVCQKVPHIENLQTVSINCKDSYIIKEFITYFSAFLGIKYVNNAEHPEEIFGYGEPVRGKKNWLGKGVLKNLLCNYKSVYMKWIQQNFKIFFLY